MISWNALTWQAQSVDIVPKTNGDKTEWGRESEGPVDSLWGLYSTQQKTTTSPPFWQPSKNSNDAWSRLKSNCAIWGWILTFACLSVSPPTPFCFPVVAEWRWCACAKTPTSTNKRERSYTLLCCLFKVSCYHERAERLHNRRLGYFSQNIIRGMDPLLKRY